MKEGSSIKSFPAFRNKVITNNNFAMMRENFQKIQNKKIKNHNSLK